jgi:hypothetical protein
MRKNTLGIAGAALSAGLIFSVTGLAQDFQKSYSAAKDETIRIHTISGDIKVDGYDGTKIVVEGYKVGRNRERVEIVDRSGDSRIDLEVHYPENCNCDASVNFQVRVPNGISFNFDNIRSVSGNVHLGDVAGHVRAESISGSVGVSNVSGVVSATSVSGNVSVNNVSGIVNAGSTSGNVDVYLRRVEGAGDMSFSSISGRVSVKVPVDLDAYVVMDTLSGSLKTDFPLEIQQRRYGPGYLARGRLGAGTYRISIKSVSGRVSLTKDLTKG